MTRSPLGGERVVAVIRHADRTAAADIARACAAGGLRAIEITWTVPGAAALVASLARELGENAVLGAGTIIDTEQLAQARTAGAQFIVMPGVVPQVLDACMAVDMPVIPGVLTPSEALAMHARGLTMLKLFPAETVGMGHLRALASVLPDVSFLPTGGVHEENAEQWFAAGAKAIGLGSSLNRLFASGGPAMVTTAVAGLLDRLSGSS